MSESTQPLEVGPGWVFDFIDERASTTATASVDIKLTDGALMTVRAGGPGVLSAPGLPPFHAYEVNLDHNSARFWRRYGHQQGIDVYASVPRLLVAHHIIRHGGIDSVACEVEDWPVKRPPTELEKAMDELRALTARIAEIIEKNPGK